MQFFLALFLDPSLCACVFISIRNCDNNSVWTVEYSGYTNIDTVDPILSSRYGLADTWLRNPALAIEVSDV
jgi:hypothetical protein